MRRSYVRDISNLVFLNSLCILVNLVGNLLRSGSTVCKIILYSEILSGAYFNEIRFIPQNPQECMSLPPGL